MFGCGDNCTTKKQELIRLIESVSEPSVLEAVKDLLNESENIYAWKEPLTFLLTKLSKM